MLNKFKQRSSESELLDRPGIPKEMLLRNLHELDFFNRVSGGYRISLNGIRKLVTDKNKIYHIVDLGCGSGALLKVIAGWASREGYKVKLTGVDRNADVIDYLKEYCREYPAIQGVACDYRDFLKPGIPVDIIHCSLFCHHLSDDELIDLLSYCRQCARSGFVINDLHRHWLAYAGVIMITRLFNGSVLSKNDGPVSVMRAFKKRELMALLQETEIFHYTLNWKWVFRYLIVGFHSD